MRIHLLIPVLAIIFFSQIANAQQIKSKSSDFGSNWELNYNFGFSQFYGDASSNGFFKKFSGELGIAQSFHVKKHFTPAFALGLNGYYGCAKSHKTTSGSGSAVDFNLGGGYGDINIRAYLDLNSLFWGYNRNRKLSVFTWLGIGYGFWDTGLTDNTNGDYQESGDAVTGTNDTYKKGGGAIPIGLGIDYRINDNWSINAVGDYRTILNDDLDVWRGGAKFDNLFFMGVGVSYHINPGFGKRKTKAKTKKVKDSKPPKEKDVKEKELEERPLPKEGKSNNKLISDVPIYDLDYNSTRIKEDRKDKKADVEVLAIEPTHAQSTNGIIYRVQILAKSQRLANLNYLRRRYNLSEDVLEIHQDGVYRYSVGAFSTYSQAVEHSRKMKNKGVSDAFVVVYKDGKRIGLTPEMKK